MFVYVWTLGSVFELRDGFDSRHGRLVIRRNGQIGTVCNNSFGIEEARVVCRMIGYS